MLKIRKLSFGGKISKIKDGDSAIIFLEQNVAGKFNTIIPIFIPKEQKEHVFSKNPSLGDFLYIHEGIVYEKENTLFLRIDNLSQFILTKEEIIINSLTFSGIVHSISTDLNEIEISQELANEPPMILPVKIPKRLKSYIASLDITLGDEVLASSVTLYAKNGVIKTRASEERELLRIKKKYDLGKEDAFEKFI